MYRPSFQTMNIYKTGHENEKAGANSFEKGTSDLSQSAQAGNIILITSIIPQFARKYQRIG